jgi:hypothetical protein
MKMTFRDGSEGLPSTYDYAVLIMSRGAITKARTQLETRVLTNTNRNEFPLPFRSGRNGLP